MSSRWSKQPTNTPVPSSFTCMLYCNRLAYTHCHRVPPNPHMMIRFNQSTDLACVCPGRVKKRPANVSRRPPTLLSLRQQLPHSISLHWGLLLLSHHL